MSSRHRVETGVVDGLALPPVPQWVADVQHSVVDMNLGGFEDELEDLVHLPLGGHLPLLCGHLGVDALRTDNGDIILFSTIEKIVVELSIGGNLEIKATIQMSMALLKEHDTVIVLTRKLLNLVELSIRGRRSRLDESLGLVENVKDIMQPRDRGQVDPIRERLLRTEAGKQAKGGGMVIAQDG